MRDGRDVNETRPANAQSSMDVMLFDSRERSEPTHGENTASATRRLQRLQRREPCERIGWDDFQVLAFDETGGDFLPHSKTEVRCITLETNKCLMAPVVFVATSPKQLGRALIAVMPCPSLLSSQQVPNISVSLLASHSFCKVALNATRPSSCAQTRRVARSKERDRDKDRDRDRDRDRGREDLISLLFCGNVCLEKEEKGGEKNGKVHSQTNGEQSFDREMELGREMPTTTTDAVSHSCTL